MQLHRGLAAACLHDDPVLPLVDNDGRVPAIGTSVKAVPGLAEVVVAIAFWEGGQIRGAQSQGSARVQVNPNQGTIRSQRQQVAIERLNGTDVQDTGQTVQSR
jgi:hypothetical protein